MKQARPYQSTAIEKVREELRKGSRAPLLVAPTGAGKTFMGVAMAAAHLAKSPGNSVAWFAHRTELCDQAAAAFNDAGLSVGLRGVGARERVQICMAQTACRRGEIPAATLSVLDEAHHYASASEDWTRIPAYYKQSGSTILGLTATPERADGTGLAGVFDSLTVAAQVGDLIKMGMLSEFDAFAPKGMVRSARVAMLPVEAYSKHSPGRSAVVFAPNVINAEEFARQFIERGVSATVVHGKLSEDERARRLEMFDTGAASVVVNVGVLTEGWDCPRAKVAIFARKIGSTSLYLQCVGRVLRLFNGERAQILDLTGVIEAHGPPDEEREYFLEGEAVRRKGVVGVVFCRVCHAEKAPGQPCEACGTAPSETEILKAQGVDLEQKFGNMRKQTADKRALTLGRWYADLDRRAKNRKSAEYKYKHVYGGWPTADVKAEATRMADEQRGAG